MSETKGKSRRGAAAAAAASVRTGAGRGSFSDHPAYAAGGRLCALVYDLEIKIPDDERPFLYLPLKRAAVEYGAQVAAGFGLDDSARRRERWETARALLMEARHYALLARSRYFVDENDLAAFEERYEEARAAIDALLAEGEGLAEGDRS